MDSLLNSTLGQYQILAVLGRGSTSTVYQAYQPALNRHVAIKVLFGHLRPEFKARFRREAQAVARLQHPNILPIYDFVQDDVHDYFVMQYVEHAVTLSTTVAAGPMMPIAALRLVDHVLDALDYAHQRGIIHRDVKPANVLMPRPDWPLLADFGIAKLIDDSLQLTPIGQAVGTASYMAPEQLSDRPIDARSDLYSTGIVLYELVTGRLPFEGSTPLAVLMKHASAPLPPPRELNPDLPVAVETLLLRALAKNPDDRYQHAAEMRAAINLLIGQLEHAQVTRQVTRATPVLTPRPGHVPVQLMGGVPDTTLPVNSVGQDTAPAALSGATTQHRVIAPLAASRTRTALWMLLVLAAMSALLAFVWTLPALGERPVPPVARLVTPEPRSAASTAAPSVPAPTAVSSAIVPSAPAPTAAATTRPGALPSPVPRAAQQVYVVQAGDTLSDLAIRFGTTVDALLAANDLTNADAITVGQPLVIPTGALVAATSFATPSPAPTDTASDSFATITLEDTAWLGGYRRSPTQTYGGRSATWIYGSDTDTSVMQAVFTLDAQPIGSVVLRIEGMDSEDRLKTPISISVNGTPIYTGDNPLPDDDVPLETGTWASHDFSFDAGLLQAGSNEIRIRNTAKGAFGLPPFFMLDHAEIHYLLPA